MMQEIARGKNGHNATRLLVRVVKDGEIIGWDVRSASQMTTYREFKACDGWTEKVALAMFKTCSKEVELA